MNIEKIDKDLMSSLLVLAWFVEARDPYTGGHLWRVSRYAQLLAKKAGLNKQDVALISLGGFLHDLGKIGIADTILQKKEGLTESEYETVKTHPDVGLRLLAAHPLGVLVRDAVGSHHERPDGLGYPKKLAGLEIPVGANIVAICDAFDAMVSQRPYRAGMPRDTALGIIRGESGKQFDSEFAEIFTVLGYEGGLDHIIGHSDDFIPLQSCPACGPTLVISRDHDIAKPIFCHSCSGEFELARIGEQVISKWTGRKGSARDLQPQADLDLIKNMIKALYADLVS